MLGQKERDVPAGRQLTDGHLHWAVILWGNVGLTKVKLQTAASHWLAKAARIRLGALVLLEVKISFDISSCGAVTQLS